MEMQQTFLLFMNPIYGYMIYTLIFALKVCLFRAVKMVKNTNHDKYSYSGYGIDFNS